MEDSSSRVDRNSNVADTGSRRSEFYTETYIRKEFVARTNIGLVEAGDSQVIILHDSV